MFDALVFAVYDCGFIARCTKEIGDATSARIENILTLINECKYGIHDISRTEPSEGSGLARFNMPLELGLFLGAARFGRREKRCLVLDREQYRYQNYISDIAGQDIEPHGDNPKTAIRKVLAPNLGRAAWGQSTGRDTDGRALRRVHRAATHPVRESPPHPRGANVY